MASESSLSLPSTSTSEFESSDSSKESDSDTIVSLLDKLKSPAPASNLYYVLMDAELTCEIIFLCWSGFIFDHSRIEVESTQTILSMT